MKKVILHVGLPKTGTTYLQQTLAENRDMLSSEGIVYHQIGRSECACHWWFATSFLDEPKNYSPVQIDLANGVAFEKILERGITSKNKVVQDLSSFSTVILSAEQFFFLNGNVLKKIRSFFNDLEARVEVVVYVREPLELALSEVNQKVKMGMGDLEKMMSNLPVFKVKNNLQKFINVFGLDSVSVRNFTELASNNVDLVNDFLDCFGPISDKIKKTKITKNKSLTYSGLKVVDLMNRFGFDYPAHSEERDKLIDALANLGKGKLVPDEKSVSDFYEKVKGDIIFLEENFNIKFRVQERDYITSPENKLTLTTEEIAKLLIAIK